MAQIAYRGNITIGHFDFLASVQGRSVIVPRQDQNVTPRDPVLGGENQDDRDRGFPEIYYMHNAMPTAFGMKSIGFAQRIPGLPNTNDFVDCLILRDINENKFLYSPTPKKQYIFDATVGHWQSAGMQSQSSSGLTTIAYLNGNTYIFFQAIGCFQYDTNTKVLDPVAFGGINQVDLNGITASNGFLIAWDDFNVYRSQPTDPLNFTPDSSLGSGGSIPNDIKGKIVCCLPISDGFIIYCTKNAVGASFQNNIQYPFIYKEIRGSAGITGPSQVTWTANLGTHFAYTTNGVLSLNKTQATQVFPEFSDFLAAQKYDNYDTTTHTLTITSLQSPLQVRLAMVADRYVVCSFGINNFTDAYIQDLSYKRWGRIKLNHVAAFEYYQPNLYGSVAWEDLGTITWSQLGNTSWNDLKEGVQTTDNPGTVLAFLQADGTVVTLTLDYLNNGDSAAILLGKYQFVRERFLDLEEVELESIAEDAEISVYDLPSINGKTLLPGQKLYENIREDGYRDYLCDIEAKNHTIAIEGDFLLNTIQLAFKVAGHA